jgi:hypothetical protein
LQVKHTAAGPITVHSVSEGKGDVPLRLMGPSGDAAVAAFFFSNFSSGA